MHCQNTALAATGDNQAVHIQQDCHWTPSSTGHPKRKTRRNLSPERWLVRNLRGPNNELTGRNGALTHRKRQCSGQTSKRQAACPTQPSRLRLPRPDSRLKHEDALRTSVVEAAAGMYLRPGSSHRSRRGSCRVNKPYRIPEAVPSQSYHQFALDKAASSRCQPSTPS